MAQINKKKVPIDISKVVVETSHADSKMYILVFERVPDHFVPVVAAHASLACYLKFKDVKTDLTMDEYIGASFKKVVCRISEAEYASYVKNLPHSFLMSESNLGYHTCVVCAPRITWPKPFKFFRMWKPNLNSPENDQEKIQVNYK